MPYALVPLCGYLQTRKGRCSGISFVDSTSLAVCRNRRIHAHKVFAGCARRGKTSVGWFYGFKLHLVINGRGELLSLRLTPGNCDDRRPVPELVKGLFGKLFGDRGKEHKTPWELIHERKQQIDPTVCALSPVYLDELFMRKLDVKLQWGYDIENIKCSLELHGNYTGLR